MSFLLLWSSNLKGKNFYEKDRIDTYNALRGLCAVGILFSHMSYLSNAVNPFWHTFHQYFMSKGAICTTFFFICSGFFLNYTWKKRQSFGTYVKSKLKRLYPLALIVFILALMIDIVMSGNDNAVSGEVTKGSPLWFFNIVANLFLFKAFVPDERVFYSFHGPSWYISALMVLYLLSYPLVKQLNGTDKQKWRKILIGICSAADLVELLICIWVRIYQWPTLYLCYVNPWFRIFGEGIVGVLLCEYMPQIQNKIKRININALEFTAIVLFIGAFLLRNVILLNVYRSWLQIIPMGFLLIAFRSGKGKISGVLKSKPFQFLGKISFELYMTHTFVYEGIPIAAGVVSKNIKK